MSRIHVIAGLFGAIVLTGAGLGSAQATSAPALASEALPAAIALKLDSAAADFTMTAAKERRLQIIENTTRQQRYSGRGYGRGYGARPGYGRDYRGGYGPRRGYERY